MFGEGLAYAVCLLVMFSYASLVWAESEMLPVSHRGRDLLAGLWWILFRSKKYSHMPLCLTSHKALYLLYINGPFQLMYVREKLRCPHRFHLAFIRAAANALIPDCSFLLLRDCSGHSTKGPSTRKGNLWRKPNFKVNEFPHPVCNVAARTLVQVWVCRLERRNCTGEMEMPFTARTMFFAGLRWL